jgi:glycosyltransferase involved in cell wall biosynthesis
LKKPLPERGFVQEMTTRPHVSIIIPTYKRAYLIGHVLEALQEQSYSDFEVVAVLKPSGDGSEEVLRSFEKRLSMRLILQEEGYVTDALNIGLEQAKGAIIAFLDDDAVPHRDWLQNHLITYDDSSVGGVAGNVVPTALKGGSMYAKDGESELIPYPEEFMRSTGRILWNCPIKGLENYLVYISKAGRVTYNSSLSQCAWDQVTKSLLGMGANMSLLSKTVKGFKFPSSWILGISWEQFLGWYVWNRGYTLVFNPNAVVNHIIHDQTLSRDKDLAKEALRVMEGNLLFYRLHGLERNLSGIHRIVWLIISIMMNTKKLCVNHELERLAWMRGTFCSELIGLKWLLSKKVGCRYSPLADLKRFSGMS